MLEAAREQRGRRASTSWSASSRRTAAPRPRRCSRGSSVLPRRAVEYRGATLQEFDLDAALARRPALILSTSWPIPTPPGSRHAKRWQDVEELLDAGHRRLHHAQRPAPREPERRRRPDHRRRGARDRARLASSSEADEVELVDLPPDELLERLREGKVYLPAAGRSRRAQQLLPQGQPDRAARAGAAPHRRARRRADAATTAATHAIEPDLAGGRAHPGLRRPEPVGRRGWCARPGAWPTGCGAEWIVAYVETPAPARGCRRRRATAWSRRCGWPSSSGAETVTLSGETRERGDPGLRARAQRHQDRGRQAGRARAGSDRCSARSSTTLVRGSGEIDVYVISGEREDGAAAPARRGRPRPTDWARLRAGRRRRGRRARGVAWLMFPCFELAEPGHGLPARRRRRRDALRARPVAAGRGPQRGRLRLLLRAAVPHLRGHRHRSTSSPSP